MAKRRPKLSDENVAALKPKTTRYAHPDPELRNHYIRIYPTGAKSFWVVASDPHGKQRWAKVGDCGVLPIAESRERARPAIQRIKDGLPAFEAPPEPPNSVKQISEDWLKRHVGKKGLRSKDDWTRLLTKHVYTTWKSRDFLSIRRSDVVELLDTIEDEHGARQADVVLAIVRSMMNWYATRHDDYVPPIVRGMNRSDPLEQERDRTLTDDELRTIWTAAEGNGQFGAFIRLALLTAQRRSKVAKMRWSDLKGEAWTIPAAKREKGNAGELVLPAAALAIIEAQDRVGDNAYVFAGRGKAAINGYSKSKALFDAKLDGVAEWHIHDLRRTARTLMSRAGVLPEIAERVLGHGPRGVKRIYDRFKYSTEKADALRKLAALVDGIVHPRDNVVPLQRAAE